MLCALENWVFYKPQIKINTLLDILNSPTYHNNCPRQTKLKSWDIMKEKEIINMSNNKYSTKFIAAVRTILMAGCADGARMTREEVCEALQYEGFSVNPVVLGVEIQDGVFNTPKQAWNLFAGRFGGIRELDLEATAKAEAEFQAKTASIKARIEKAMATKAAKKVAATNVVQTTV